MDVFWLCDFFRVMFFQTMKLKNELTGLTSVGGSLCLVRCLWWCSGGEPLDLSSTLGLGGGGGRCC